MPALTANQRSAVREAFNGWLNANRPGHTAKGSTLLDYVDKLRRYAKAGRNTVGKYTATIGPIVAAASLTASERTAVRTHCLGG